MTTIASENTFRVAQKCRPLLYQIIKKSY